MKVRVTLKMNLFVITFHICHKWFLNVFLDIWAIRFKHIKIKVSSTKLTFTFPLFLGILFLTFVYTAGVWFSIELYMTFSRFSYDKRMTSLNKWVITCYVLYICRYLSKISYFTKIIEGSLELVVKLNWQVEGKLSAFLRFRPNYM